MKAVWLWLAQHTGRVGRLGGILVYLHTPHACRAVSDIAEIKRKPRTKITALHLNISQPCGYDEKMSGKVAISTASKRFRCECLSQLLDLLIPINSKELSEHKKVLC